MSTFGRIFRVTTYGESHCASVGAIVDGCPPGLELAASDIQVQLSRRRPGQSNLTTPRDEKDLVQLQSGIEQGVTLGTPIGLLVRNEDQRPKDYSETDLYPRPSHADLTYLLKYGVKASSGGGRASARETIGRVAAGAIAEKYLRQVYGVEIVAFVTSVGKIHLPTASTQRQTQGEEEDDTGEDPLSPEFVKLLSTITREEVDKFPTRCPDGPTSERMTKRIIRAKDAMDSIGGTVTCVIRNSPAGLGEPVFDKFEATLAHAMLSIPATKGFEIGSGFRGTEIPGSKHNDPFMARADGTLGTKTNWSGGIQGGITNGENIYFRVAFKSPATISQAQATAQYDGTSGTLAARGRHDPCVVPRAVPIVEAMAALVLMDQLLIQNARRATANLLPPLDYLPPSMVLPPKRVLEKLAEDPGAEAVEVTSV
ncbi:Chorismate synthase; AltName: Full=5-enolpyruvylshikimate-3-phosphate phospholyase [Serendipita indica DSM 11827]|uniref:Chorismate synthase n=1 Tax=Serendipita indica (strain DSM 11827) TaxID=1109443 RepID=G4TDL5_SERID|nr:Chorismate synthase; AltName: Full=5-enolpyruvylshikimate-3-phosphate phospholyase [Serendipita indica DSM 11827]CCA69419.1 probable ARO2-chorismate synthase [Serendipita indica DSM 11827]